MENQHRKITGYRELSQEEINLMNEIKIKFAEVGELILKVEQVNSVIFHPEEDGTTSEELCTLYETAQPYRWTAIAKTHAQEASMALTRAVAKPDFF